MLAKISAEGPVRRALGGPWRAVKLHTEVASSHDFDADAFDSADMFKLSGSKCANRITSLKRIGSQMNQFCISWFVIPDFNACD